MTKTEEKQNTINNALIPKNTHNNAFGAHD